MKLLIDTREQRPLDFPDGIETAPATLAAGDYSAPGLEEHVAIERKELSDFIACIGPERDRFKRELARLRGYPCRAVVIESDLRTILNGEYRSQIAAESVLGSLCSWMTRYKVPFIFASDRSGAARIVVALVRTYRAQVEAFLKSVKEA